MKKSIAIGIICLIIGVGVYPAVAVETSSPMVNNQDDCGCETVNSIYLDRIGSKLERLRGYTNNLILFSKRNPVIYGKCLEISEGVNTITDYYEELSYSIETLDWEYTILCAILEKLYNSILATINALDAILDYLEDYFFIDLFLGTLIQITMLFLVIIGYFVEQAGWNLNCDWAIVLGVNN